MPPSDEQPSNESSFQKISSFLSRNLNFYRLHILYFTFTPLIFSGIFYASNGRFHIAYIDALFNSVSAMVVCGLASVDLSSLTAWQQTILFFQMCLGNPVLVSWFVVFLRRRMFTIRCENIVRAATRKAAPGYPNTDLAEPLTLTSRLASSLHTGADRFPLNASETKSGDTQRKHFRKLHPDMIRRVDGAPKLVNPSGSIIEGAGPASVLSPNPRDDLESSFSTSPHGRTPEPPPVKGSRPPSPISSTSSEFRAGQSARRYSENDHLPSIGDKAQTSSSDFHQQTPRPGPGTPSNVDADRRTYDHPIQRTQTIEFAPYPQPRHRVSRDKSRLRDSTSEIAPGRLSTEVFAAEDSAQSAGNHTPIPLHRSESMRTFPSSTTSPARHEYFGGFPGPQQILSKFFRRFFPGVHRQLRRSVTMPRTTTITSIRGNNRRARAVPYISFDAVVRNNSVFESLTDGQLEELGGVEFRALNALLWIVGIYHISTQLFAFIIIAPYMSMDKWKNDFRPPQQHRPVIPTWFSLFQVVSAYTNAGMSLVDQSMVPFQRAYPMIFSMMFVIFAGNTAFPIFLRFSVWILTKLVPRKSRLYETLHFLLDHPRRCFIYLFPSHQTWFLLTVLVIMTMTDWFSFLILDLGNPTIGSIPTGVRVIDGLFQATAVRAAGFAIVSLSALAPAVKVLYVIMMYISIYPIAMSVRSTNVYEERSLGIYKDDISFDEEGARLSGNRMTVWGNYLAMHARKQLAFDMWWLGLALFLVCIIERDQLENAENATWFNIFNTLFELVSAYGGVGLSLGLPYANYSLSGAFRPLSKLIVCLVMLRGRHRGLPVAIDRAVLLPFEYRQLPEDDISQPSGSTRRRRLSSRTVRTNSPTSVR